MRTNDLQWKVGGEAGYGIMATGQIFSRVCSRGGLSVCSISEYPSRVRGGRNTYTVRVSDQEIHSHLRPVDILIALDLDAVEDHVSEVVPGGAIVYDSGEVELDKEDLRGDVAVLPVPMADICKEQGAPKIMRNNVALGASFGLLGFDFALLEGVIKDMFGTKGSEVVEQNTGVAQAGYDLAGKKYPDFQYHLETREAEPQMIISGNESVALGAIKAGIQFHVQYPMTPSSAILHYLAAKDQEFGYIVKQPEDEIAAINMAAGAAFAGARSMVATSGGGFSLMVEGLGLAGMIEVPVVIIMGQRTGPSTGLPTWTEQGDLRFVLHASQGDFPRMVLAPGDVEECFYLTAEAFNLADRYQTPVIVLTDKHLAEDRWSVPVFDQERVTIDRGKMVSDAELDKMDRFWRYDYSFDDGVSLRSVPGQRGGIYTATSDEHDEYGMLCEAPENRRRMNEKRWKKLLEAEKHVPDPNIYGPEDAPITLVAWGSNKGVCRQALSILEGEGINANLLHLTYINPFPTKAVAGVLEKAEHTFMVENNISGQMHGYIREKTGYDIPHKVFKYDGRPFFPEEIAEAIREVV